jgi:hypothetical protein
VIRISDLRFMRRSLQPIELPLDDVLSQVDAERNKKKKKKLSLNLLVFNLYFESLYVIIGLTQSQSN